ncbi:MAG: ABC transporter substrate-binding protein [Clostridiales bacterium]|nr:ABC transporter substrate-binding protein [Clostridiales bacterium]
MKKIIAILLSMALCIGACMTMTACSSDADYVVGISQYMVHDSLDQATQGFKDALEEALEKEGKSVEFKFQVGGENSTTVATNFVAQGVDLIMANATPALVTAANATSSIPVLGTSVTDYNDTFNNNIPANVSGTSDAVPFAEQADMMVETLGLVAGDKVGVIYCTNESNSVIQYNAVKAEFESKNIQVQAYTFSETTELQAVATSAASSCDAIYIPSDNTVAQSDSIVGTICTGKNVPVYTSYGGSICYASLAIDYYQLGAETGKMAAQILLGQKTPADIPVKTIAPSRSFNSELCSQLGITVPNN